MKYLKITAAALLITTMFGCSKNEPITPTNITENLHYEVVKKGYVSENSKPLVAVISITCPHCYDFSQSFKYMEDKIEFIPVGWDLDHEKNAKIVFTAKHFSKENEIIYKLFDLYKKDVVSNEEALKLIASVTKTDFKIVEDYFNSEELLKIVKNNINHSEEVVVNSVPTLFIKDKKLNLNKAETEKDLKVLIEELIKR